MQPTRPGSPNEDQNGCQAGNQRRPRRRDRKPRALPRPRHIVRFIEYMDVDTTNGWRMDDLVPAAVIIATINQHWPLEAIQPNYPARSRRGGACHADPVGSGASERTATQSCPRRDRAAQDRDVLHRWLTPRDPRTRTESTARRNGPLSLTTTGQPELPGHGERQSPSCSGCSAIVVAQQTVATGYMRQRAIDARTRTSDRGRDESLP
jgi:hypothetical protein